MTIPARTISEARQGLKEKKFSCEELTRAYLDRIEKVDKDLNSYITVIPDEALESARKVDEKISRGEKLKPLEGIPVGIKDLFNTRGVKTTCASNILKDFVPPYSAAVIQRLEKQNCVLLGKTNLDEFACGASTEHSAFGVTKNPWDLERVPGGSSGGSAAAVAADLCVYALGTDTGGSIRQPSSLCGVTGLKVTYGRVSRSGVTAMASSLDTIGPIAKNVEDIAEIMNVIAGPDVADATTPKVKVPDFTRVLNGNVKGLKIGVPKEYFAQGVEPEVAALVKEAISKMESLGAVIEEVSLPMSKYGVATYYITMPAELSANLARYDAIRFGPAPKNPGENLEDYYINARSEGFGDEIKRRIMVGAYVLSSGYYDAYYKKAQRVRTLIIEDFNKAFEKVDVLIAPTSPYPAFKIGEMIDDPLAMYLADVLTCPVNIAGLPGLALPCGFSSSGLPVGMQIIGPQFSEDILIGAGNVYQKNTDFHTKTPKNI